jgi:secretion/DNA translocation related CpaE-like protein
MVWLMESHRTPPLLVTADADIREAVLRLAAAADVEIALAEDAIAAQAIWARAPLVLIGADCAAAIADAPLSRHAAAHVVSVTTAWTADEHTSVHLWQSAVALGARGVARLPEDERIIIDLISDVHAGDHRESPVVAVIGGCGGAGGSTFAARLALTIAGRDARGGLLIDADPHGGGIDLLLEAEREPGLRWRDLLGTRGRVSPEALRQALPHVDGVGLLSHDRTPVHPDDEAIAALLQAGNRGYEATVVDLGRCVDHRTAHIVLSRSRLTILIVPGDLRALAAGHAIIESIRDGAGDIRAVLRTRRGSDLDADDLQATLGVPVFGEIVDSKPASLDRVVERLVVELGIGGAQRRRRRAA